MDRGAWPFFVDGVTCLVNFVSVCEEKREERREKREERREKREERREKREERREKREERREKKREERREKKREERREIEMKRNKRKMIFQKNVSRPSNPPDELAQNVSNKIPFGRIIRPFFLRKFRI